MASSQGTQPSKMNTRGATLAFIQAYSSLPELWDAENIMTHVGSKQQTRALFSSTIVIHTRRHTELTKKKKIDKPGGKHVLCQRTVSSVFRAVFYAVKLHSLT